jgi:uncharacterized OB-fold protein
MMADDPLQMPAVRPHDFTKEFWAALAAGSFLLQHDERKSDRLVFPPRPFLGQGGTRPSWTEASGTGVLVAFTVCRVPARGFQSKKPYLVGIVKLDEGPRVFATIVNAQAGDIRFGQKMKMVWLDGNGELRLYAFEPAQ